jgi:4-amino-4-deoxy-L-arabinose transferase-like glycosyltransferase
MFRFALSRLRNRYLLFPLALCISINALCLLAIWWNNSAYLRDYRTNYNPDARDYVFLGRNFFLHGEFSRSAEAPFRAEALRTPGYPLFAGGLDLLGGSGLIYVVQIALHCGICMLVFALAGTVFGPRAAFVAALFAAVHPTLIVLNMEAMSEILFLFVLLLAVLILTRILGPVSSPLWQQLLAGLLLGLAILVRPAGLYLPLLIALFLFGSGYWARGLRRAAVSTLAFLLGVATLIAPWIVRNYVVFDVPHLTTADAIILVYFTGAGAYQLHHQVEQKTAQQMIADEFGIDPPERMWNNQKPGPPPGEMDRKARGVALRVLLRYPVDLVKSCALGVGKAMFSHDAPAFAHLLNLQWNNPGTGPLLRLDAGAWRRLRDNPIPLTAAVAVQLLVSGLLIVMTLGGIVLALWKGIRRTQIYFLFAALVFFVLVCGANGIDAYARHGAPILPFAFVFAGCCGSALFWRKSPATGLVHAA